MATKHTKDKGSHRAWDQALIEKIIDELQEVKQSMQEMAGACASLLDVLHQEHRQSSVNLLHYLALRRHDIRPLQEKLSALGLSSLGRTEAHVMASVNAVLRVLHKLAGLSCPEPKDPIVGFADGRALLDQHTDVLLGPKPGQRKVRIMVTMPSEAADNYLLVRELLAGGMDCMRINCAHDDPAAWERMIENLRRAKRELGKKCRILMDMAGPKLRTGPVDPIPQVLKWRPHRDRFGRVLEPARIWLAPEGCGELPDAPADGALPLPASWLAALHTGDVVEFNDTRGAGRTLKVVGEVGSCRWCESDQTSYVASGTGMYCRKAGKKGKHRTGAEGKVGELPPVESALLLKRGDTLILTRDLRPGISARYDDRGRLLSPATIGCTLPEMFTQVRPGDRIWLDDGKIGGVIRSVGANLVKVEITAARPQGDKLRAEKGINLPDSKLTLPALTD